MFFYCLLGPFMSQNHSPRPFLYKYWWHDFKSWILERKNQFHNWFSAVTRKWGQNYDLYIFQILHIEALLELEMNSLGRFWDCFDVLFVSGHLGWSGQRIWKMYKMFQKLLNTKISRHLIRWYFWLFFLTMDWNWIPATVPHPSLPQIQ